ncbi:hypothetical protein ACFZ8E_07540 [Methylobacterium sp. HMF5984]|uniref:phage adaptor protein n=1 Tax=Methylobacterium sp. HMF5984 TaxID=3367370 RepID=UPI0038534122
MPITLGDIRARVIDSLKRRDVPLATLDRFITDGIRRIQFNLRTPLSEAQAEVVTSGSFTGKVNVPNDLLNLISLQVNGMELTQRSVSEVRRVQTQVGIGQPTYYCRVENQFLIAPLPGPGALVHIDYHQDFAALVNETDTNPLIDVCPQLVTWGALINAGDWSLDPARQAAWAQGFATAFAEIQEQADRDILLNASMAPCHAIDGGIR